MPEATLQIVAAATFAAFLWSGSNPMTKSNKGRISSDAVTDSGAPCGAGLLSHAQLTGMARFGDMSLLALRQMTGIFLVQGVWDNIVSPPRMNEFARFLESHNFPIPEVSAPLSVAVQFAAGMCFIFGFATRAAGIICALNFIVAIAMVHWNEDFRGWWPALSLIGIGAMIATHGSGRFGIDRLIEQHAK